MPQRPLQSKMKVLIPKICKMKLGLTIGVYQLIRHWALGIELGKLTVHDS